MRRSRCAPKGGEKGDGAWLSAASVSSAMLRRAAAEEKTADLALTSTATAASEPTVKKKARRSGGREESEKEVAAEVLDAGEAVAGGGERLGSAELFFEMEKGRMEEGGAAGSG